jgi:hypothetical protein
VIKKNASYHSSQLTPGGVLVSRTHPPGLTSWCKTQKIHSK